MVIFMNKNGERRLKEFLDGLTELSRKYGLVLRADRELYYNCRSFYHIAIQDAETCNVLADRLRWCEDGYYVANCGYYYVIKGDGQHG